MQKCSYCGADLPEDTRFCGKCGSVQETLATNAVATGSATPQSLTWGSGSRTVPPTWSPYSNDPEGSRPAWSANGRALTTPTPVAEDEDKRRKGLPLWSPFYGAALTEEALLGSGLTATPSTPFVQGTPQIGSAPSVAGSPFPYTNGLAGNAAPVAGNAASVSPSVQGAGNVAVIQPVQGPGNAAPVSHPIQGPANAPISHPAPIQQPLPVSHPVPRPRPTPQPPEPPGTHKHHPPHKPHRHHTHEKEHEPHRDHDRSTEHKLHRVTRVSKVAGGSSIKTILIVVATVLVVAAGGIAAAGHFLSHPQPHISISSSYKVGNTLAGAQGTSLQISGQQFSSNSAITLLLDGQVAPGSAGTHSDSNGNFSADVAITDAWSVGTHTLTARDANNYSPKNGVSVTIVQPGQANTPGPNGAPPDDATFTLNIPANGRITTVNQPFPNNNEALHISGHPDPAGGTVCLDRDNGQQSSTSYVDTNGTPFTETYSFSCKGSYKSGKISFTETLLTDVVAFNDGSGVSCTLTSPQLNQQVTGSYTGKGTFSGTWTYGPISPSDFNCSDGSAFYYSTNQGGWTGTVSGLQS